METQPVLCTSTIKLLHDVHGREKIGLLFALINGYNFKILKAMDYFEC